MSSIELYSYTGERVAQEVEDRFGDSGNAQITKAMLLTWINNGIRQISDQYDFLTGSASTNLLAGQGVYDLGALFTTARIKSIESITVSGRPLTVVPFGEYLTIAGAASEDTTGTPATGTLRGSTLTLWPVPSDTLSNALTVYYTSMPADLANLPDTLTLPDRFYNALVDYCMAQALELDENFEASAAKLAQHDAGVRRQFERDTRSPTEFYSTITFLDED